MALSLLRGITSNHKEDFYCLNCFHSFRTENKLMYLKNVSENHDYCYVVMPKRDSNKTMEKSLRKFHLLFMLT